jgi:hypothetical protein
MHTSFHPAVATGLREIASNVCRDGDGRAHGVPDAQLDWP